MQNVQRKNARGIIVNILIVTESLLSVFGSWQNPLVSGDAYENQLPMC